SRAVWRSNRVGARQIGLGSCPAGAFLVPEQGEIMRIGKQWLGLLALAWLFPAVSAPPTTGLASGGPGDRGAGQGQRLQGKLIVFNAGSLAAPMGDLLRAFVRLHPGVEPEQESSGSLDAARKITELGKACDLLAVADYEVIPSLLVPQYAEWYALFARNQMVLIYTGRSKFAGEINSNNWYEILLRPGVEAGHSDPHADPAGYRTLLVWQLAEKHYQTPGLYRQLDRAVPAKNIRPKSVELVALLQSGELDYIYGYRSIAEQDRLPFVTLPPEIDLSDMNKADLYA